MMKPTPTTCMAISLEIPKRLQAMGISSSEPPATPEAPQAPMAERTLSKRAVGKSTEMPRVWTAARVMMEMVMAAPDILMVAPSGMVTVYVSGLTPSSLARDRLTGIFAAELRVKKAVTPDVLTHFHTSGYGLRRILA